MHKIDKKDHRTPKWLSELRAKVVSLKKEREQLEAELMNPSKMKAGTYTVQYRTCGNKNCRCFDKKDPFRHGPYYYLVVQNNKQGVRQKIIKDKKEIELLKNYQAYNELVKRYERVNIELLEIFEKIKQKRGRSR